jgi:hypothetical protein
MRRVDRRSRRLWRSVLALFAGAVVLGKEFAAGPGAVGVSGDGEDFGVVTSRSIIAAATTLSLNVSPHIGDVFYASAAAREEAIVDAWLRQKGSPHD